MEIKNSNNPELLARVQSGELKIGTAYRMLPKQILKQLREADKLYAHILKTLPAIESPKAIQDIHNRFAKLYSQQQALLNKFERRTETTC